MQPIKPITSVIAPYSPTKEQIKEEWTGAQTKPPMIAKKRTQAVSFGKRGTEESK
jgi:hypothetical protein